MAKEIVLKRFKLFGSVPVTADKIAKASLKDPDIATVSTAVQHGSWSHLLAKPPLLPYHRFCNELSVIDHCQIRDRRVVISQVFCRSLVEELHSNHMGIMKNEGTCKKLPLVATPRY